MARFSKKKKVLSQSLRTKKLCPHCGHDDFEITQSKMSWLFGQKFKCAKCGGTFKQANLVGVREQSREFNVGQTGTTHRTKKHKQKPRER